MSQPDAKRKLVAIVAADVEEALAAREALMAKMPDITLAFVRKQLPITEAGDLDHLIDGLRKAGIPKG